MVDQQHDTKPTPIRVDNGVSAPPVLLWMVVGFFLLVILTGIVGVLAYRSQQRITALIPVGVGFAVLFAVGSIAMGVIFRQQLPRRFLLWLLLSLGILAVIGVIGVIFTFSNLLPPRYQQQVLTEVPFMRAFLPPTPAGGIVPTAEPVNSSVSPADLLNMAIGSPTPKPDAIVQATASPTSIPTLPPKATFTPSPKTEQAASTSPATLAPATQAVATQIAPTQAALVVTQASSSATTGSTRSASARLYGFKHAQQTWNNCGPANITQALTYYGWTQDQSVAADYLKPEKEDKNVSPGEMVSFVNNKTGVRAITRIGGNMELIKTFIANSIPVIIETGYMPEGYDWIGHYQTIVGYDDLQKLFYIYDTFLGTGENGEGISESYQDMDNNWQAFNRTFIAIYKQEDEGKIRDILGVRADLTGAADNALAVAQQEARTNMQNGFAWFNMGTALTKLGRYDEAAIAYDKARQLDLPFRMLWYQFGPFEAYFNAGRYEDVLSLVSVNLTNAGDFAVEETYYWQGKVYAKEGKNQDAINAFRQALIHNPHYADAQTELDLLTT